MIDRGHTVEPPVPLSDDEIAFWAGLPSWTLTEALFLLSGHKPPYHESAFLHIQDHFWSAYNQTRLAIRQGIICQKTVEAGETIFYDTPARWLAWADRIGPAHIEVDDRMRRALSQMADSPDGTVKEEPQPAVSKSKAIAEDRDGGRPKLKQGKGRPTLMTEIEAAYKELRDAEEIDFDAPLNKLYGPIRKKVRAYKNDPSLKKGLGIEAIRKVISPPFETGKSARSTSP